MTGLLVVPGVEASALPPASPASSLSPRCIVRSSAGAATPTRYSGAGLDPAVLADPGADSRPTMLWFWNGAVTTALIDSQ